MSETRDPATAGEILSRAWRGDPERPRGSARPEWLAARAAGQLDPDGRIKADAGDDGDGG